MTSLVCNNRLYIGSMGHMGGCLMKSIKANIPDLHFLKVYGMLSIALKKRKKY